MSFVITDHALSRYCERILGLSLRSCGLTPDELRAELSTPDLRAAAALGAKKFRQGDAVFAIRHGAVVTVLTPAMVKGVGRKQRRSSGTRWKGERRYG